MMKMRDVQSVYFIGIGGIGMSAIARYFNENGAQVSGYDRTETPLTKQLVAEGMQIFFEEDVDRIPKDVDLVVYTPAIPAHHTELQYYQNSDIPTLKRAVVLGKIVNEGDCYAVAGSHGKSTTSAMLAHVLQVAGRNTTAFLGAIAANYNSNYVSGGTDNFVVEADEYDRSFHQIQPTHTIITAVDSDHLDIYGTMAGVEQGFLTYVEGLRAGGTVFIPATEPFIEKLQGVTVSTYGVAEGADFQAKNWQIEKGGYRFDVQTPTELIQGVTLKMGGLYNIENATAVIAMACTLGVSPEVIKEAFASFRGLKRRFEVVLETDELTIIDDYAHHPHEIRSFIKGVKELYPGKRIGAIFQPHLFSRTRDYAQHFAESLELVDEALIMDIYPAREEPIEGVTSKSIADLMTSTPCKLVSHETVVAEAKKMNVDVLATVGAGDISKAVPLIVDSY